jgi:Fe-S cluster assembly iron-binding protein IscA
MTVVAGFDPTEISLSDSAVGKLQFLIAEEDNPSLRFRVYITGGGVLRFSVRLYL